MLDIRTATAADAARLSEFARRTFHDTFAADNSPDDMAAYLAGAFSEARQRAEIEDPDTTTLIAEQEANLVGYAQLRVGSPPASVPDRDAIELVRLYVAHAWHGRGIAATLMQAAVDVAAQRSIWLGVWERNARAIAFYKKCGFVDVGTQFFQLGSDRQTDRVLWRRLSGGV